MRSRAPRLTVPEHAHPLVRALFEEMRAQQCSLLDMADRSGVNKNTLRRWRDKSTPRVADLEACFNVLGMRLTPMKRMRGRKVEPAINPEAQSEPVN